MVTRSKSASAASTSSALTKPITQLKGVGAALTPKLKRVGLDTVLDLLLYVPRRYDDYSKIVEIKVAKPGQITVKGKLERINAHHTRRGFHITEAVINDGTGKLKAIWFNQPYRAANLPRSEEVYVAGVLDRVGQGFALSHPSVERVSDFTKSTARIVPTYPETRDISSSLLRRLAAEGLKLVDAKTEYLPADIIKQHKLLSWGEALREVHFPTSSAQADAARHRLAFDELFALMLAHGLLKQELAGLAATEIPFDVDLARGFVGKLPFKLTDAQRRAAWEILQDMAGQPYSAHAESMQGKSEKRTEPYKEGTVKGAPQPLTQQRPVSNSRVSGSAGKPAVAMRTVRPMNRLLQGDVGSGKTVVAAFAALMSARQGIQVAVMAPTEVLARQHLATFSQLLEPFEVAAALLVGGKKDEQTLEALATGHLPVVVGTHALIQKGIKFKNLGLVVVDEQHRFGVRQRQILVGKSHTAPHVLSMTATPIPRSLTLTLYGELDVSVIDELPPGRKPVQTRVVPGRERAVLYKQIDVQVGKGRQVYVICPLIEDSDVLGVKSVTSEHDRLEKTVFAHRRIGLLHGKLKAAEKEAVLDNFKAGKLDILLTTTVVEVGVDVPNASVLLVEGAERFGLAQLHQLRGRVGRGEHQSYCYLLTTADRQAQERLAYLERTQSGFELAEADLRLRGPGELYGTRQHGELDLHIAKLTDMRLISGVQKAVRTFVDQNMSLPHYPILEQAVSRQRVLAHLS